MPIRDCRLSVVIPVFNGERYLSTAVASVESQGWSDREIIVVDDGSTDRTREVAEGTSGLVYIHQRRSGAAAARNTGVRAATGRWLAFLDADDYWAPAKTASQLDYLARHGTDMVFGLANEFYSEDVMVTADLPPPAKRVPARCAGTMLIAREAFLRAGDFPTEWRVGEFIDWSLCAIDSGLTAGMLTDVVLHRRLHAHNMGRSVSDGRQDYLRIIKQSLDRRRAVAGAVDRAQP